MFLGSTSPFDARKTALHKVAKLLYFQALYSFDDKAFQVVPTDPLPFYHDTAAPESRPVYGLNAAAETTIGTRDLSSFYGSIRVFFHPSNTGSWSQDLGFLLGTQVGELARHVGREIAIRHGNLVADKVVSIVRIPLHEGSIGYMIGMFTSLLLEMLYSKNFVLSHIAGHGLKNLAPLNPSLCDVIIPTLVATLDPSAMSKSHMALPAMTAISLTFKSFLYPQPAVLRYLPSILQLALPGIDSNDMKKSLVTMNLYCRILSWIPIGDSYDSKLSDNTNLLSLAGVSDESSVSMDYRGLLESTKACMLEWGPLFLDRMLTLLDATEDSDQQLDGHGSKSRRHKSGSARSGKAVNHRFQSIEECFRLFFAAMSDSVAVEMCQTVLSHLKSVTALHASKEYKALMTYMVASHPESLFKMILSNIVDDSLRNGECSPAKIAFRLHLAGGAVRKATCAELLKVQCFGRFDMNNDNRPIMESAIDFLKPFLDSAYTIKHPDIRVKEAARKLVRDLLRGLSATYAIEVFPLPSRTSSVVLGETSPSRSNDVKVMMFLINVCIVILCLKSFVSVAYTFRGWSSCSFFFAFIML